MSGLRVSLCKQMRVMSWWQKNDRISPIARSMALDEDPSNVDNDWEILNWTINRLIKKLKEYHPYEWSTSNVNCYCLSKYGSLIFIYFIVKL